MSKILYNILFVLLISQLALFAQTDDWMTEYVVFDNSPNGTGNQTPSVGVIGPNRFVASVTETPESPVLENLFAPPGNYLVGYWDADSGVGRVNSPINGSQTQPIYGATGQFTDWESGLDKVTLQGAWQVASYEDSGFVYVANNDENHNILVFRLTQDGVTSTPYRMETGTANIFGIEVDTAGYVYTVDYKGDDTKTDEVKVFAGIGSPNATWSNFPETANALTTTIDLPPGIYQGITVSNDGSSVFVSATSERKIWKFTGDPETGYTQDMDYEFALSPDDTVANFGSGTPSVLGLGYLNEPELVFAAVDTFIHIGGTGGYPYGRIYVLDANNATSHDTINIAQWNLAVTGLFDTGSNNGRAGGFTSVVDVDVDASEKAFYSQTYYGWAVEKWIFDGDIGILALEQLSSVVPQKFALKQNYPNPFNPNTTIEFNITMANQVKLEIYNVMGQKVSTLVNRRMTPGSYKATFDGSGLSSGIYFYQLTAGSHKVVKKMILTQ